MIRGAQKLSRNSVDIWNTSWVYYVGNEVHIVNTFGVHTRWILDGMYSMFLLFFQAEDGIRDFCLSRGLGDVYKRQFGWVFDYNFLQLLFLLRTSLGQSAEGGSAVFKKKLVAHHLRPVLHVYILSKNIEYIPSKIHLVCTPNVLTMCTSFPT